MIRSNSLLRVLRRLMGLYAEGSVCGLFGLGMGMTFACFQELGK